MNDNQREGMCDTRWDRSGMRTQFLMGRIKISTAWNIQAFEQEDNTVMNLKEIGWKSE